MLCVAATYLDVVARLGRRGHKVRQPAIHVRLAQVSSGQLAAAVGGDVAGREQRLQWKRVAWVFFM